MPKFLVIGGPKHGLYEDVPKDFLEEDADRVFLADSIDTSDPRIKVRAGEYALALVYMGGLGI